MANGQRQQLDESQPLAPAFRHPAACVVRLGRAGLHVAVHAAQNPSPSQIAIVARHQRGMRPQPVATPPEQT
eukprot:scaffold129748_cov30-Tisochrysis_lutea.AAC.3